MSSTSASTLEQQNDDALDSLFSKVKALRSVTVDIHEDSERQRGILGNTSETFDRFGTSLSTTSNRFTRTISQASRNNRLTVYIVAGVVSLFLLWYFFR